MRIHAKVEHVGVDWQAIRIARQEQMARMHMRIYQACLARLRAGKERKS